MDEGEPRLSPTSVAAALWSPYLRVRVRADARRPCVDAQVGFFISPGPASEVTRWFRTEAKLPSTGEIEVVLIDNVSAAPKVDSNDSLESRRESGPAELACHPAPPHLRACGRIAGLFDARVVCSQ